ncbi:hypothetical protein GHT06_022464 [Daphnia sinensis]|uniref:Uncharacterized protein n=1 Tax=Daphnia sinensis TaxID=1820382 RepID=A0AAD5KIF4_9CRUS|nr:hypothetical protein GHT06_022464 [Daphnia sinensis]
MGPNKKELYILTGSEAEIGAKAGLLENKQVTHLTILIVILKSDGPWTTIGASHSILKRLTSAKWEDIGRPIRLIYALPCITYQGSPIFTAGLLLYIYVNIVLNKSNKKKKPSIVWFPSFCTPRGFGRSSVLSIGRKQVLLVKMQLSM